VTDRYEFSDEVAALVRRAVREYAKSTVNVALILGGGALKSDSVARDVALARAALQALRDPVPLEQDIAVLGQATAIREELKRWDNQDSSRTAG
jgi:hypothetical protein